MAVVNTFRVGDPVWGKLKGFSAWPGKIVLPPDSLKVLTMFSLKLPRALYIAQRKSPETILIVNLFFSVLQ